MSCNQSMTLASLNFEIGDEPLGMPRDPNRPKPGWAMAVRCIRAYCGQVNCFESNPDKSAKLVIAKKPCTGCAKMMEVWVHE